MKKNILFFLLAAAALIILPAIGFVAGKRQNAPPETVIGERVRVERDTVWMTDTLLIESPQEISGEVIGAIEAVLPVVADSAATDSALVSIPIERKVYADSNYRAVVEGFNPSLVSLEIYRPKEIVTVTETHRIMTKPTIAVGPSISIGYDPLSGRIAPVVGISVTIPIFTK